MCRRRGQIPSRLRSFGRLHKVHKRMLEMACKILHILVPRNNCSLLTHAKFFRLTKLKHKGKKLKD